MIFRADGTVKQAVLLPSAKAFHRSPPSLKLSSLPETEQHLQALLQKPAQQQAASAHV